jgi:CobQ/CobB/MinD/ParA nucleotide binding domain
VSRALRFDDALSAALAWVQEHQAQLGNKAWLLRDVLGRIHVVTSASKDGPLATSLHETLGAFSPGPPAIFLETSLFEDDQAEDGEPITLPGGVKLVDRLVSEQGWRRAPVAAPGHRPRITFFGIKGGVGRSTALVALARKFAELGRRVLVVDLDLESPGVSSMLLEEQDLPRFGVVDWFVEDAVGQGDEALARDMVRESPLGASLPGTVLVAPAVGSASVAPFEPTDDAQRLRDGAFVAKLGRAYASPDGADFAERLEKMLGVLEHTHAPDFVLLDSRAGLHDISAATVPRLGGTVLLFAGATSQTMMGYKLLFSTWRRDRDVLSHFRDRLRIVAAQVPETGREAYIERVRDGFSDLFTHFIYDLEKKANEVTPGEEEIASEPPFSFNLNDPDAPHAPLPVYWRRELVEWEPAAPREVVTSDQLNAAFGPFLEGVLNLPYVADALLPEEAEVLE